ncbi:hypothetical protein AB8Z38_29920 [Bradyrhizobium sp. LLZ17]|uniref:Uncharacterized protein n=1 Tax=Bradyrhizobium sp. LLZ17 TaxID=3239388 RepID=A0AB39XFN2_9BRAD
MRVDDEGYRLQYLKVQGNSRGVSLARKAQRRAPAIDRFALWVSTSRTVDGLWVGSTESKPQPGLRRVEAALGLIKDHDPLNYARTINNLERIWVRLIPNALAHYDPLLSACVIDERLVLPETTALERIASTIVHESTHARLERWGINYDDERVRSRIEAICLRRELKFVGKLAHCEQLQEQISRTLEWCVGDDDYFSNPRFQQRHDQGDDETASGHLRVTSIGLPFHWSALAAKRRFVISFDLSFWPHADGRLTPCYVGSQWQTGSQRQPACAAPRESQLTLPMQALQVNRATSLFELSEPARA